jgi:eukaryotic-like serine/threonine-protein kinase
MSDPKGKNTAVPPDDKPHGQSAIGNLSVTYISKQEPMATVVPASATPASSSPDASTATNVLHRQGCQFRIIRPHARGGMGEVSVATDIELNREVALKEIQARFTADIPNRMRFVLEAEVTGALEHPGIVPVYGLGQYQDGRPYYAMRFVRGDSLKEAVDRFHHSGGIKAEPREFRAREQQS